MDNETLQKLLIAEKIQKELEFSNELKEKELEVRKEEIKVLKKIFNTMR